MKILDWGWDLARRRRRPATPDSEPILALRYGAELATVRTENQRLEKKLSDVSFEATGLRTDATHLERDLTLKKLQLDTANARIDNLEAQLRARPAVELHACECGGDTELHWRRTAEQLRAQAARDRTNAVVLDNRLAAAEGRDVIGSLT